MKTTKTDLEYLVGNLNAMFETNEYYLDGAYGGWRLWCNGRAVTEGFVSKPVLLELLQAYSRGAYDMKKKMEEAKG